MIRFRLRQAWTVVAVAGLVAAGCSSSKTKTATTATTPATSAVPANTTPIKIGVMLPMSGPFSSGANYMKVLNTVSKQPGRATIDGRPYTITLLDDTGSATVGGSVARQLLDQDHVDVVFGTNVTAVANIELPLTTAAKTLQISLSGCPNCGNGTTAPYAFSLEFDRPTQGPATITRVKALGQSSLAILESQDPTSKDYSNAVQSAAAAGGVTVSKIVPFQPATLDLSNQVAQLKAANVGVVYIASFAAADLANVVKAMEEVSYHPVLMGNSALGTKAVSDAATDKAWVHKWESSGYGLHMLNGALSPQVIQWRTNLKAQLGASAVAEILNAQAAIQDAFDMFKAAVEATHSTDGPTLATWIQNNGFHGLRANYTFTAQRHNGFTSADVGWAIPGTFNDGFLDAAPATGG